MSVFSFIKGIILKKREVLPSLPEKPGFEHTELSLPETKLEGLSPEAYELLKAKLDLINVKIDNLDRKISNIEKLATEK